MEYVVWSNPLALLSHKLFKTTWGRHEVFIDTNPYPNSPPLVPTLFKVKIDGKEYLLDSFGHEFVIEAVENNSISMREVINRAATFDKSWMLIWS